MGMIPDMDSLNVMGQYLLEMDAITQIGSGDMPPVLFVYGEKEAGKRVPFMRKHFPRDTTSHGIYIVPGAPHDYYARNGPLGFVFCNYSMISDLTAVVKDWALEWGTMTQGPETVGQQDMAISKAAIAVANYPWPDLGHLGIFYKWSKVEIELAGPHSIGLSDTANPFKISVDVTIVGPEEKRYTVPGFYVGDGDGGMNGYIWKVLFSPDKIGTWTFVSQSNHPLLDGYRGSFTVELPTTPATFFAKLGILRYVGAHYLKFADGPYWLKGGTDDPEDFLAPGVMGDWPEKRRNVDYLASKSVNSMYIMLHNVDGDGDNVWPWATRKDSEHFDVAKLRQWEDLFSYIQSKGIVLHLVLEDDSGWTGFNRAMYYREMVARFSHHNGIYWNISEEYEENYSPTEIKLFAQQLRDLDPYDHPITVHHAGGLSAWKPFLGDRRFEVTSFQTTRTSRNAETIAWRNASSAAGRPVVIAFDETGKISLADRSLSRLIVWSVYLGGGNIELHTWPIDSFQEFEYHWNDMKHAALFLQRLPFWEMVPRNDLLVGGKGDRFCFAKPGEVYAIYIEESGSMALDLSGYMSSFDVRWYNPRNGEYSDGVVVQGGEVRTIGSPPFSGDAAAVIELVK
jgi:hypothetical protein